MGVYVPEQKKKKRLGRFMIVHNPNAIKILSFIILLIDIFVC